MSDETPGIEKPAAKPILRVVKGDLTAEETAALVAVIAARNAAAAHAATAGSKAKPRSEWGRPSRSHRTPHQVGPDQWRRSAFGV